MKSIEFIGAPGSGKSYYEKEISKFLNKKNIETLDYNKLFFHNYPHLNKSNIFLKIKFFLKKLLINKKYFLVRYLNYTYDKFIDFNKEYNKINNNYYTKKFFKLFFKKFQIKEKKFILENKLKKWLTIEIASINIAKKIKSNKKILINSEGINQRISRLVLDVPEKKINNFLKELNYSKFQSDIVIFVDTKPNACINRLKLRNDKKYSKNEIKKFYSRSKYLFKNLKQKKFILKKEKNNKKNYILIHEYITY